MKLLLIQLGIHQKHPQHRLRIYQLPLQFLDYHPIKRMIVRYHNQKLIEVVVQVPQAIQVSLSTIVYLFIFIPPKIPIKIDFYLDYK
jgi:hypothetical protein